MKLTKKHDYNGTIRKVWNDDKSTCVGVIGTVGELIDIGVLEFADYDRNGWFFIPAPNTNQNFKFGKTREDILAKIKV